MITKIAINRFSKELGSLSSKAFKRLNKAGLIRAKERMVNGLETGTTNMAKSLGVEFVQPFFKSIMPHGGIRLSR